MHEAYRATLPRISGCSLASTWGIHVRVLQVNTIEIQSNTLKEHGTLREKPEWKDVERRMMKKDNLRKKEEELKEKGFLKTLRMDRYIPIATYLCHVMKG